MGHRSTQIKNRIGNRIGFKNLCSSVFIRGSFSSLCLSVSPCLTLLIRFAFGEDLAIGLAGVLVGGFGVFHFAGGDEALLLLPAGIDAVEAPFGAALAS